MKSVLVLSLIIFSFQAFSQEMTDAERYLVEKDSYAQNLKFMNKLQRALKSTKYDIFSDGLFIPKTKVGKKGLSLITEDVSETCDLLAEGEELLTVEYLDDLTEANDMIDRLRETFIYRIVFVLFLDYEAAELSFLKFGKKRKLKKAAKLVVDASKDDLHEIIGDSSGDMYELVGQIEEKLANY